MGAVYGIVGGAEQAELRAMSGRLTHRGGDSAEWSPASGLSLGTRGSPEAARRQMGGPIAFDGAIDNREELAAGAGTRGRARATSRVTPSWPPPCGMRSGRRAWPGSPGSSPLRCGTHRAGGSSWPGTGWATRRSISRWPETAWSSPASTRRCWRSTPSRPGPTAPRSRRSRTPSGSSRASPAWRESTRSRRAPGSRCARATSRPGATGTSRFAPPTWTTPATPRACARASSRPCAARPSPTAASASR